MTLRAVSSTLLFFGLGFVLEHLPMPEMLSWFQPPWMLLFITLLVLHSPHWFGVWVALPIGLLLDVEHHQLLGYHVLTLTIYIALLQALWRKLKRFNDLLLSLVVIALVVVNQLVGNLALWAVSSDSFVPIWQPVVSTALIWIWLRALFSIITSKLSFK